nr:MAG TPA: N-hydroxyarylamine O-acetyltransferase [Caudoviricetes sp.]
MKVRVKETGEVLCWDDVQKTKLRVLLKGSVCTIPYQNIEVIQLRSSDIDWEQRRYELAKAAMQGYCIALGINDDSETYEDIAIGSLRVADALIKKLKGD